MLDNVKWHAVSYDPREDEIPYVTHQGTLSLGGFDLRCYQLNDGRQIIDAGDLEDFFLKTEATDAKPE
jgi:hypothetical protein